MAARKPGRRDLVKECHHVDMLKFIHAADFHLDAPFRGGRPGYGQLRRQDVRHAFSTTIDLTLSEQADLLLLCGDLFEQDGVTRDTVAFMRRELSRLGRAKAIILPGNHDPYTMNSWYRAIDWPAHVHILSGEPDRAAFLELPEIGVFAAGFGFTAYRQEAPDFSTLPPARPDWFNLLLIHGTLDMPVGEIPYHPVTSAQLAQTGYDYAAFGHFHKPFEAAGSPYTANPGSPEPLGFDEPGEHGVLVGSIDRRNGSVRVTTHRVPVAARVYVERRVDLSSCASPDACKLALADALSDCSPERHLPHVRLTGTPLEAPDVDALADWFGGDWLLFRLTDDTRPPLGGEAGLSFESLTGLFCRNLAERLAAADSAGDREQAEALRRARQMGLEALAYGTVHMPPER